MSFIWFKAVSSEGWTRYFECFEDVDFPAGWTLFEFVDGWKEVR